MNDLELQNAEIRNSNRPSAIWILPIVALCIGAWLLWQALIESPIEISIEFPSGSGIEVGKTKVLYEGLAAGVVTDMQLDMSDLKGVEVKVAIDHRMATLLKESTEFWLVKPEISLRGITGLETIVTGNYIALKPGQEGKQATKFQALKEPPAFDNEQPGLHIVLRAESLGSIRKNSPVMYKKIQVGAVAGYTLSPTNDGVLVRININPEHAHLVTSDSRFWNASGIRAKASWEGVEINSESLVAMLQGGITFDSPQTEVEGVAQRTSVERGTEFLLYPSAEAAERMLSVRVQFPTPSELKASSTKVLYKGFEVGKVEKVSLSDAGTSVNAQLSIQPEAESLLTDATRFWLVKPEITLEGVQGLNHLLTGPYVELSYAPGEPQDSFVALDQAPRVAISDPGLQLILSAEHSGSLMPGAPVLYRQVAVGKVEDIRLRAQRDGVEITVTIEEAYRHLINDSTRFWNASGIAIEGSLAGINVDVQSILSLIKGGVSFSSSASDNAKPAADGQHFTLYETRELAQAHGVMIRLHALSSDGVTVGTPIKFQGYRVGEVKEVELKADLSGVLIHAALNEQGNQFAVQGSQFWLVKPHLGLSGAEHLETLVRGQYLQVNPGAGASSYEFELLESAPNHPTAGLPLVLKAKRLNSVRRGLKVHYRDIVVGEVTGYELAKDANSVLIRVIINAPYDQLVRSGTRFWNASGVNIDFGLFSGAEIRTESLESILYGGVSFATPEGLENLPVVEPDTVFSLHKEVKQEWLNWSPNIVLTPSGQ